MATTDVAGHSPHSSRRRFALTNSVVRAALHSPVLHRLLDRAVCELRFAGRRTRRAVNLPVMYAREGDDLVILVGGAAGKAWWRNFTRPHPVDVRLLGAWHPGIGRTVPFGHPGRAEALRTYHDRYPDVPVDDDDPFVVITFLPGAGEVRVDRGERS